MVKDKLSFQSIRTKAAFRGGNTLLLEPTPQTCEVQDHEERSSIKESFPCNC